MKDLSAAKKILGMRISRDHVNGILKLSQEEYVKRVISWFNMNEAKYVSILLANHFKLTKTQATLIEQEHTYMNKISYVAAVGSLMYAMVYTRADTAHAVGIVSKFMNKLEKQHWKQLNEFSRTWKIMLFYLYASRCQIWAYKVLLMLTWVVT